MPCPVLSSLARGAGDLRKTGQAEALAAAAGVLGLGIGELQPAVNQLV